MKKFSRLLIMLVMLWHSAAAAQESSGHVTSQLEDSLAGVELGSTVEALLKRYSHLYQHTLVMGEVLYEACNQERLQVFTFAEEPWSKGSITHIWVRNAEDVSVCRDAQGSLPDLGIDPSTPRGVRLGDPKARVLEEYGDPRQVKTLPDGRTMLEYRSEQKRDGVLVENLRLFLMLKAGNVVDISLSGDMSGAKKPF